MSNDGASDTRPTVLRSGNEPRSSDRPLTVFLPVPKARTGLLVHALVGDPAGWLPLGKPNGTDRWLVDMRLGPLRRTVIAEVGPPRATGPALTRSMSWWPPGHDDPAWRLDDVLPRFDGELILHRGRAVLVLDGTYQVPGGRLGEVADAAALARLARRTGSALVAAIIKRAIDNGDEREDGSADHA